MVEPDIIVSNSGVFLPPLLTSPQRDRSDDSSRDLPRRVSLRETLPGRTTVGPHCVCRFERGHRESTTCPSHPECRFDPVGRVPVPSGPFRSCRTGGLSGHTCESPGSDSPLCSGTGPSGESCEALVRPGGGRLSPWLPSVLGSVTGDRWVHVRRGGHLSVAAGPRGDRGSSVMGPDRHPRNKGSGLSSIPVDDGCAG